jgi:hypothetical protein
VPYIQILVKAVKARPYPVVVDSGSNITAFPLAVAAELGLTECLIEDKRGVIGLGEDDSKLRAYRPQHVTIYAQVIAEQEGGGATYFGSDFQIFPIFIDGSTRFVVGRDDFFKAFVVCFPRGDPRVTVLEY